MISTQNKMYRNLIPDIVKLLVPHNRMSEMFTGFDPYEMAMVERLFGKQLCDIIEKEGNATKESVVKIMELTFESNSKIVKEKKVYKPRGYSAYSIVENLSEKHKYGKDFSTKFISSKVMKALEKWGYVESFVSKGSIKIYKINGYKKDFLH